VAYLPAYAWAEIKSHLKVIYLALHPKMPIRPGIVEVPTSLRTDVGITWLANSITMTPGTLSVDVDDGRGVLYVHWIDVEAVGPREAASRVAMPFERFLRRIAG
jgi:multicomponent Na+:H+ antiporter subunit E